MKIVQTSVNWIYPRVSDIRKKYILSEDVLCKHFMKATVLSVPDEVQEEVPRIIVNTRNNHSLLNLALTVSSFTTLYDGDFLDNWSKCMTYLQDRCDDVYRVINSITEGNNTFVGIVTRLQYDATNIDGLKLLKESIFKEKGDKLGDIKDASCKLTYIMEDKYYVNIELQNVHRTNIETGESQPDFIGVTLDINDRYMSNINRDYRSTEDAFDRILKITEKIINQNIEEMILNGRFEYNVEQ